jgi:pimeloyl-ACP methyl ester carboxylesterase
MCQPVAHARERAALMPNAGFELVPGGHEPWLDDVEVCAQTLAETLRSDKH